MVRWLKWHWHFLGRCASSHDLFTDSSYNCERDLSGNDRSSMKYWPLLLLLLVPRLAFAQLSTSTVTEQATVTAGNPAITLNAPGDFLVGQGVFMAHAGQPATVLAPTGLTGLLQAYNKNPNPSATINHPVCNVDSSNASCTTPYTIALMAVDSLGGWSPASASVTVTNGPATLSVDNGILWSSNQSANAVDYIVLGCATAGCTPTQIWAIVPERAAAGLRNFWDFGNHFGSDVTYGGSIPTTVQATGANQDFSSTITAINGNTITLASAPGASGTFTLYHDNAPIINAMIAGGGDNIIPQTVGAYQTSTISFFNTSGVRLGGTSRGSWPNAGTQLVYIGSAGGIFADMNWAPGAQIHDLSILTGPSTPGFLVDVDARPWQTGSQRSKGNQVFNLSNQLIAGVTVSIGADSTGGENEFVSVHDSQLSGGGGYMGFYIGAGWQTDNTRIENNLLPAANFGEYLDRAGTVLSFNNDGGSSKIFHYNNNYVKEYAIDGDYTEGGPVYWLYDAIGGGNVPHINVRDSQIVATPGSNGYEVVETSGATFIGNEFGCGTTTNNCLIAVGITPNKRRATFIGNSYASQYPASFPVSIAPLGNLPITDAGGVNSSPVFISIGETINLPNGNGDIAVPDIFSNDLISVH